MSYLEYNKAGINPAIKKRAKIPNAPRFFLTTFTLTKITR